MAGRSEYLNTEAFFMEVAKLAAQRSKDPETQVGACIIKDNKIVVGIGYNHMLKESNEFSWARKKENPSNNKHIFVIHAETCAIINKTVDDINGCTIYVTLFPCNECAKAIIEAGITEVVYLSDKYAKKEYTINAKKMFDKVGVSYRQYVFKRGLAETDVKEESCTKRRKL
ncbi:deoxycytidylate deaminase-like [Diabrotica undecimpunctata]|uniref:deoxycytidylate deaminase-like n=1 Tax=Diabrotica undecimpunctata TaxID=50387 RepID=UPI003B6387E7